MNLDKFNTYCIQARIPPINADQWTALLSTTQGKVIEHQTHDQFSPTLELIVRSLSPTARQTLEGMGLQYDLQRLIDTAEIEQKTLFAALHKSSTEQSAKDYILQLGFKRAPKAVTPAPYYSFSVYGTKGALCISEAQTRSKQIHTINVEGALALGKNEFDWRNKLILQLSPEEMFLVLAVLNGKIPNVVFTGHGESHDKMFEMMLQTGSYFIRLVQKGRSPVSVPMDVRQTLNFTSLIYKQIKKNHPHLGMDELRSMEDQLVRMHATQHI